MVNNNFASFPPQLANFRQIEKLDMSGNHLNGTVPTYIQLWQHLKILHLKDNNYNTWLAFEHTSNILKLDLSGNKIYLIDQDAFVKMPRLAILDLSENRLSNLPTEIFSKATRLEVLILSLNFFSVVPNFQSVSLKNLHLSNCQITSIDVNSLNGMQSLLELDLSMNEIESIPDNLASNSLQELDLSYNTIDKLTDATFSSLPHLAVLDLRGNDFKEVWSTSYFASNPFLREVQVKGNRWSCEGFSVNLLLTYEFLTKDPAKVSDNSLMCYSPENVTQMSWQQAYIRTWHADEGSTSSYTLTAVMIGMIIGIILTSMVCRIIIVMNKSDAPRPTSETTVLNTTQSRAESVVLRVPVREDLPPSYDEALLMPRLNDSFHSLPDFVDAEENQRENSRRSRSIGDLTESRPRLGDRRSVRRTVEIRIN